MKLKVLATSVVLIFAVFAEASNLKQFFGASSGGSGIELKVAATSSNVCPACPGGSISVGCYRGNANSPSEASGWFASTKVIGGYVIGIKFNPTPGLWQSSTVDVLINGVAAGSATYVYYNGSNYTYTWYDWGFSLCRVN